MREGEEEEEEPDLLTLATGPDRSTLRTFSFVSVRSKNGLPLLLLPLLLPLLLLLPFS